MDTIKLLDSTEVGMYMVVVYNNDLRCPAIYMGTDDKGIYTFLDDTGIFKCTTGYIKDHVTIDQELTENEMFEITKLLETIKTKT